MPELALVLYVLFLALAFGWRTWLQRRRTGSAGFHGISGRPGSVEWTGGVLFVVALALGLGTPVLALVDVVEPVAAVDRTVVHVVGVVLAVTGAAGTLAAQGAMGASWRIGVDQGEHTELVTDGAFRLVRNPVFAAMLPASLGLALMVPSLVAAAAFIALWLAVELQVRYVEEPYLLTVHGDGYASYAIRVGRFVPGVGTLSAFRPTRPAGG